MKTLIILFLLMFTMALFAQIRVSPENPFTSGADTVANITAQDTLDWQLGHSELGFGPWTAVTNYISAAEKTGETLQVIDLDGESGFSFSWVIKLRIRSSTDTVTSRSISLNGPISDITVFIKPDTIGTDCIYDKVRIGGR